MYKADEKLNHEEQIEEISGSVRDTANGKQRQLVKVCNLFLG